MSNTKIWDAVKRPPASALKQIKAGRLAGMSDINPQWRLQVMTEQFGPCGIGWKYTIDKLWTEPGSSEQVMAFALVSLYTRNEESWSEPVPGIGGSTLIAREKSGLHSNDEAFKMAITDALSVAMKALGVAADIYSGLWDGSKYRDPPKETNGSISPTDGALDNLSADQLISVTDDAKFIVDSWNNGDKLAAFDAYMSLREGDQEYLTAVWHVLKPHSAVRNGMKKMYQEAQNGKA